MLIFYLNLLAVLLMQGVLTVIHLMLGGSRYMLTSRTLAKFIELFREGLEGLMLSLLNFRMNRGSSQAAITHGRGGSWKVSVLIFISGLMSACGSIEDVDGELETKGARISLPSVVTADQFRLLGDGILARRVAVVGYLESIEPEAVSEYGFRLYQDSKSYEMSRKLKIPLDIPVEFIAPEDRPSDFALPDICIGHYVLIDGVVGYLDVVDRYYLKDVLVVHSAEKDLEFCYK
jgi:hypothetical protein